MTADRWVGPGLLVAALVLVQGGFTGAPWHWALLGALASGIAWGLPALRHGLGSLAMGGVGMLLGGLVDTAVFGTPSCHGGAPAIGFSTGGMVFACTATCVWLCGAAGRPRGDLVFHGITLGGMLLGEEAARAAGLVGGWVPGHWTMVGGMAVGTAIGALSAGLLRPAKAADAGGAPHHVGERAPVELGEHGVLAASEHAGERAPGSEAALRRPGPEALGQVEVRLERADHLADADLVGRSGEHHAAAAPAEGVDEAGELQAADDLLDVGVRQPVTLGDVLRGEPLRRDHGEQHQRPEPEIGVLGQIHATPPCGEAAPRHNMESVMPIQHDPHRAPLERAPSLTPASIRRLVEAFYTRVQDDPELGPIFDRVIGQSAEGWAPHLDRMTAFWSAVLLAEPGYKGNPRLAHMRVGDITPAHFDRWIALFRVEAHRVLADEPADEVLTRAEAMRNHLTRALFA